jgi:hypothetical protein
MEAAEEEVEVAEVEEEEEQEAAEMKEEPAAEEEEEEEDAVVKEEMVKGEEEEEEEPAEPAGSEDTTSEGAGIVGTWQTSSPRHPPRCKPSSRILNTSCDAAPHGGQGESLVPPVTRGSVTLALSISLITL